MHHRVLGFPPITQGEVESNQFQAHAEHLGVEDTKRLVEEFLTRLITLTHDET
jgi:hypothetical protein